METEIKNIVSEANAFFADLSKCRMRVEDEEYEIDLACGGRVKKDNNAIMFLNSTGSLHRSDGPAFVSFGYVNDDVSLGLSYAYISWWIEGRRHNADGPSIITYSYRPHKREAELELKWHRNGVSYTPSAHERMLWQLKKQ